MVDLFRDIPEEQIAVVLENIRRNLEKVNLYDGHTIRKHVDIQLGVLKTRLTATDIRYATSFYDFEIAAGAVQALLKQYYEERIAAWLVYQMREQERKEKEKAEARRNEIEKWKKEVLAELDATGTEKEKCAVFSKKLRDTRYGDKDKRKVCLELLEQRLQKGKIYAEEKELAELADELLSMVEYNLLDWKGFREMINNMEVSENESAGNGAA